MTLSKDSHAHENYLAHPMIKYDANELIRNLPKNYSRRVEKQNEMKKRNLPNRSRLSKNRRRFTPLKFYTIDVFHFFLHLFLE